MASLSDFKVHDLSLFDVETEHFASVLSAFLHDDRLNRYLKWVTEDHLSW